MPSPLSQHNPPKVNYKQVLSSKLGCEQPRLRSKQVGATDARCEAPSITQLLAGLDADSCFLPIESWRHLYQCSRISRRLEALASTASTLAHRASASQGAHSSIGPCPLSCRRVPCGCHFGNIPTRNSTSSRSRLSELLSFTLSEPDLVGEYDEVMKAMKMGG